MTVNKTFVAIALLAFGGWLMYQKAIRPSYYRELKTLFKQVITPDHIANDTQMGRDIQAGRKLDPNKKVFDLDDIERDRQHVLPSAQRAAKIDLIAREWEATARGETLPQPPRYLNGYQHTWLPTRIPIYGCVRIWAQGEIIRDPYTKAGPNGINVADMPEPVRKGFQDAHGDKTTLLTGVPWGAFSGKVCRDAQGAQCGVKFPIGESAYLSPDQVGAGQLWVIPNGFVWRTTGAGILSGLPDLNLSDYNAYQGGYRFDQEPAPDYKCEAITSVAQR